MSLHLHNRHIIPFLFQNHSRGTKICIFGFLQNRQKVTVEMQEIVKSQLVGNAWTSQVKDTFTPAANCSDDQYFTGQFLFSSLIECYCHHLGRTDHFDSLSNLLFSFLQEIGGQSHAITHQIYLDCGMKQNKFLLVRCQGYIGSHGKTVVTL